VSRRTARPASILSQSSTFRKSVAMWPSFSLVSSFDSTQRRPAESCSPADTNGRVLVAETEKHTCSIQLGKNIFQCFQAECAAHGNVLDLWAAVHRLPLYEAALHLAATFHLPRNREEPVMAAQHSCPITSPKISDQGEQTNGQRQIDRTEGGQT
jgi:hypothetical protein